MREQFALRRDLAHFASFYLVSHPRPVREAIEALRRALDENPFEVVEHGLFTMGMWALWAATEVEYQLSFAEKVSAEPPLRTSAAGRRTWASPAPRPKGWLSSTPGFGCGRVKRY